MHLHHSRHNSGASIAKHPKSSSSTAITSRNTSATSSTTYNETSHLLPHEDSPLLPPLATHPQLRNPSQASSATASLHNILTLHPSQIAYLEQARAEEDAAAAAEEEEIDTEQGMNRHVLSRIDCIEIDLWHERIRDYGAAELGLVSAAELGLVREEQEQRDTTVRVEDRDGGRLSRVQTYVNDFADVEAGQASRKRKASSVVGKRFGSVSLSLHDLSRYFWVDVVGVCLLILLVLGALVFVGFEIKYDREGICDGSRGLGAQGFWVAVQMLVALMMGLMLQLPVHRGLVPFMLPLWALGTFGIVIGFKMMAGCLGE
ncbi:hypothetical protein E4T48_01711 [Aureobasidium sp. EXF-10727]|nr:hypothetical protein E4T48_01711 [Aureobasidium sp. EXF-10727]